jgi:F0F1-type ATP synthase assembly protein I
LGVERIGYFARRRRPPLFNKNREKSPYFHLAMDFGYTLLAAVLLLGWFGWKADQRFATSPWLMIVGVGLGIATGFSSLFRRLNLMEQRQRAQRKAKDDKKPDPRL